MAYLIATRGRVGTGMDSALLGRLLSAGQISAPPTIRSSRLLDTSLAVALKDTSLSVRLLDTTTAVTFEETG